MIGEQVKRNLISLYLIIALVTLGFTGFFIFQSVIEENSVEAATTRYVGSGQTHTTIGAAITTANAGDTIRVYAGTYNENVVINKRLTIIGNGSANTTINGGGSGDVVKITADWINISGFKIMNSGNNFLDAGIIVNGRQHCTVSNNNVTSNRVGIYVDTNSHFCVIENNTAYSNRDYDISITNSDEVIVNNNTCQSSSAAYGIYLIFTAKGRVTNNFCYNLNAYGIYVSNSLNPEVINNTCFNNRYGIKLRYSDRGSVDENTCYLNIDDGISLESSNFNNITNNTCWDNECGVFIQDSYSLNLSDNTMQNDGIYIIGDTLAKLNSHSIDTTNTVNNKPYFYWKNKNGATLPANAGQVMLVECQNITVQNQDLSNTTIGLKFAFSENMTIKNNKFNMNKKIAINFHDSNRCTIIKNICTNSEGNCIFIENSNHNILTQNNCSNNVYNGIFFRDSKFNNITENELYNNSKGLYFETSNNNLIEKNICNWHRNTGIRTYISHYNKLINNTCQRNEFDGMRIYDSKLCTIHNNRVINNNWAGITVRELSSGRSKYNTFSNNTISNNGRDGLFLTRTQENTILNNTISYNNLGINTTNDALLNTIYHNNILFNTNQVQDHGGSTWNNDDFEGNYWSDYTGLDNGVDGRPVGDGIGDTLIPHLEVDNYPFILRSGWLYPGKTILKDPGYIDFNGSYNISWNKSRGIIKYVLEEDTQYTFDSPTVIYEGTNLSYNTTDKQNGTYYYSLMGIGEFHDTGWSNVVDIIVDWLPDTPRNFTVSVYPEGNALNFSWNSIQEDTMEYCIYSNFTGTWKTITTITAPQNTYNHTGLKDGVRHFYQICARDYRGQNSSFSEIISAVPKDSVPPTIPTGLNATAISKSQIEITWNPNSENDLKGYNIHFNYADIQPPGTFLPLKEISNQTSSYLVSNLNEEVTYYFKILAFDEVPNKSEFSKVASTTTLDQTPPKAPIGLNVSNPTSNSLTLTWAANPENDISGYMLFRSENSKTGFIQTGPSLINGTQYIDTGLEEETEYYYKVRATDHVPQNSSFSEVVIGKTILGLYPPEVVKSYEIIGISEDGYDNTSINLHHWFFDKNSEPLIFRYEGQKHISVTINEVTGKVMLRPDKDWYGSETITFYADDGVFDEISDIVTINVRSVNDPPVGVSITSPENGIKIKYGTSLDFEGVGEDADLDYGDKLTFIWYSKSMGKLGEGKTLKDIILNPGTNLITLEVTDKTGAMDKAAINVVVIEKPEVQKTDDNTSLIITSIIIIFLIILLQLFFMIRKKKKSSEPRKPEEEFKTNFKSGVSDQPQQSQQPRPSFESSVSSTQEMIQMPSTLVPDKSTITLPDYPQVPVTTAQAEEEPEIKQPLKPEELLAQPAITKPMLPPADYKKETATISTSDTTAAEHAPTLAPPSAPAPALSDFTDRAISGNKEKSN